MKRLPRRQEYARAQKLPCVLERQKKWQRLRKRQNRVGKTGADDNRIAGNEKRGAKWKSGGRARRDKSNEHWPPSEPCNSALANRGNVAYGFRESGRSRNCM